MFRKLGVKKSKPNFINVWFLAICAGKNVIILSHNIIFCINKSFIICIPIFLCTSVHSNLVGIIKLWNGQANNYRESSNHFPLFLPNVSLLSQN